MDIEDLVTINGRTKFEDMDIDECLDGMLNHIRHNGVILDGLRRLSKLCSHSKLKTIINDHKF